jgi:hypothetical protein
MAGLLGRMNTALVGPGATRGELAVGDRAGAAGAAAAPAPAPAAGWSPFVLVVVAVVAFDLFGGAAVNATRAGKRWWHRPGRNARHHLGFVAVHVVQPALLAWAVPGFAWAAGAAVHLLALLGAAAVLAVPGDLRRPAAFAAACLGIAAASALPGIPAALAWFAPVLLIKLLPSHLVAEEAREVPG